MIYLDFETRSEVNLFKTGAWRYAEDATTEPLCLAFQIKNGPVVMWQPGEGLPRELEYYIEQGFKVEAHNAFFERAIWRCIMVPQYGWLDIPDNQWACSAAKAAAHALPRALEKVAIVLDLPVKKNMDGRAIMLKLSKPQKPTKADSDPWRFKPGDFAKLRAYCRDDVRAEKCLSERLDNLNPTERRVWFLDQQINERGVRIDVEAVEAAIEVRDAYKAKLTDRLQAITQNQVLKGTELAKMLKWVNSHGLKMTSLDKENIIKALKTKLPWEVKQVLLIRQRLGMTSVTKYDSALLCVCKDDRIRDHLMYHGAGTGRWTGKHLQPHNLPKNKYEGDLDNIFALLKQKDLAAFEYCNPNVLATLSQIIRGLFIASPGHRLIGGDYNAIEARVLAWLADDQRALRMFREGKDLYVDMAQIIYSNPELTKKDTEERDLGKKAVLGAGYQMGWKKFRATCETEGIIISEELAKRTIEAYRAKYFLVVRLWEKQEKAAKYAVDHPGVVVTQGKLRWGVQKDFLFCLLPSGRRLAYYKPETGMQETPWKKKKNTLTYMSVDAKTKQWVRTKTYGGMLVENCCQAVARDLMANAMLTLDGAGYPIVFHTHDEITTDAAEGFGSVEDFENKMCQKPAWADGLPIRVEGWANRRYIK